MKLAVIKEQLIKNSSFIIFFFLLCIIYFFSLQFVPATITIEMRTGADDTGQLFFDRGLGYREPDSIIFSVKGSDEFEKYSIRLPGVKIKSIRIDPITQPGTFELRSISIEAVGRQIYLEKEDLQKTLTPLNQVTLVGDDDVIHGVSHGIDPFFRFDGLQNANSFPLFISVPVLLILLLFVCGARYLFYDQKWEFYFALFLLIFALPTMMPLLLTLVLSFIALLLFLFLLYKNARAPQELALGKKQFILPVFWQNENLRYNICLLLILVLAFLLRFINLTILDPYTDEYSHLVAAKEYIDTGFLRYTRAPFVTYISAWFCRLGNPSSFYDYVFWSRLPGVIFSTLTVIPLYLATRRISKPVALISALLWATSPWAIGVAKTIREYAYYPFFIMLAVLLLIEFFELLFEFKWKHGPVLLLLILPVIALALYAFRYDTASTLRICMVVFAGVAAFYFLTYIIRFKKLSRGPKILTGAVYALSIFVVAWMILYANKSGHTNIDNFQFVDYWLRVFFVPGNPGAPLHWWGEYPFLSIALFISGLGFLYAVIRKHYYYYMHFIVFTLLLIFYVFIFDRYDRPRYIFYALPFFSSLIAMSIYALIDFAKKLKPRSLKIAGVAAVFLFIFQTFDYQSILYPVLSDEHGYVKTTNEHHDYLKSTIKLLEKEISPDDVFITTIARSAIELGFNIDSDRIYNYSFKEKKRFEKVEKIISENPQGFMILDWRRNGYYAEGFPKEGKFMIGDTEVEVIFNQDGMQVYRWKR